MLFCFFFLLPCSPLFSLGSSSLRLTQSGMERRSPDSDFWLISTVSVVTIASKVAIVLDSFKTAISSSLFFFFFFPYSYSSSFSLFCACCSSLPCNLKLSVLADHYKSVVHDLTEQIDPPGRDHNGRATTTKNPFFFALSLSLSLFLNIFQLLFYSFLVRNSWLHSNIKPAMAINSLQQIPEFSGPHLPAALYAEPYYCRHTEIQPVALFPSARWH